MDEGLKQLQTAFLNRKQVVDENGVSASQSHLIVNLRVSKADDQRIVSFVDLVGFDGGFTQKIMDGSSFLIHGKSALMN